MADGESIATAYVTIRPDASGFRDELRSQMAADTGDPKTVKVNADTTAAKADLAATGAVADRLGAKTETIRVNADTARARADMAALGASASAAAGSGAGGGVSHLREAMIGLGSSLAPVGSVLAGLGVGMLGIAGAAGIGFGALRAAVVPTVSGINAAATAQNNYNTAVATFGANSTRARSALAQMRTAMANLSPAEQAAAANMAAFKGHVQAWQQSFDPQLLPALAAGLGTATVAMSALTPVVQGALGGLTQLFGSLQATFANPAVTGALRQLGSEVSLVFANLGPILGNLIETIVHVVVAAEPLARVVLGLLQNLTGFLAHLDFSKAFGPLLADLLRLGPIVGRFLESILQLAGTLLRAVAPIGVALFQVVSTAIEALLPVIRGLGQVIQVIAPVVSEVAQALAGALGGAIRAIAPIISALLPVISEFARVLGSVLVADIKVLAPAVDGIARAVAAFATAFGAALGPASQAIAQFLRDISPLTFVFAPIGKALGDLAPLAAQLGATFGRLLGPLLQVVGAFLSAGGTVLGALIPALAQVVSALAGALLPLLNNLAPVIGQVAGLIGTTFTLAVRAVAPIIEALAPIVATLAQHLGGVLYGALTMIVGVLQQILPPVASLAGALGGLLLTALRAVVPIFLALLPPVISIVQALTGALVPVIGTLISALEVLIPPVAKIVEALGAALAPIVTMLAGILVQLIADGLAPLLKALLPLVLVLADLLAALLPILPPIIQLIALIVDGLLAALQPLISWITQLAVVIVQILSVAITGLVGAITWLLTHWRQVWQGIKDVWGEFSGWITGAWHSFTGWVSGAWSTITGDVTSAWDSVFGSGGAIMRVWNTVFGTLKGAWEGFRTWTKNLWNGITGDIKAAWNDLTAIPGEIWSTIKTGFVNGINSVIGLINGFLHGIKSILSDLGLGSVANAIPTIGLLSAGGPAAASAVPVGAGHFYAAGGTIGGGFVTNGPRAIVGEGNPAYPEFVIPTDPAYRNRAIGLYQSLGGHLMADGGILGFLGSIGHAVSSGLSDVAGIGRHILADGASVALGPIKAALDAAVGSIPGLVGQIGRGAVDSLYQAVIRFIGGHTAAFAGSDGNTRPAGGFSPTPANAVAVLAQRMAAARGWTGNEWAALNDVGMRESGWNMIAQNPTSSAWGIAQFINGPSEYYTWGGNPNTASGQITAMLNYIASRYGDPIAAWAHEMSAGWYAKGGVLGGGGAIPLLLRDSGGPIPPGLSLVANGLGHDEWVVPHPGPPAASLHGYRPGDDWVITGPRGVLDPTRPVAGIIPPAHHPRIGTSPLTRPVEVIYQPTYQVAGGLSGEALAQVEALDAAGRERLLADLAQAIG